MRLLRLRLASLTRLPIAENLVRGSVSSGTLRPHRLSARRTSRTRVHVPVVRVSVRRSSSSAACSSRLHSSRSLSLEGFSIRHQDRQPKESVSAGVQGSLTLYASFHPLNAWLFRPEALAEFSSPTFLLLTTPARLSLPYALSAQRFAVERGSASRACRDGVGAIGRTRDAIAASLRFCLTRGKYDKPAKLSYVPALRNRPLRRQRLGCARAQ